MVSAARVFRLWLYEPHAQVSVSACVSVSDTTPVKQSKESCSSVINAANLRFEFQWRPHPALTTLAMGAERRRVPFRFHIVLYDVLITRVKCGNMDIRKMDGGAVGLDMRMGMAMGMGMGMGALCR